MMGVSEIQRLSLVMFLCLSFTAHPVAQARLFGLGEPKNMPVDQVRSDAEAGKGASYYKWDRSFSHTLAKAEGFFVPGFQVKFVYGGVAAGDTSGSSSSRATGGGYIEHAWKAGQRVEMDVELKGVSDADLQVLTDRIYADFMRQLADSGLKILPTKNILENPGFSALKITSIPYLSEDTLHGSGITRIKTFSPTGLPLFFFNGQGNMGAFGLENNKAIGNMSRDLNAIAIMPRITLSFMKLESSGNHVYIPVEAEVKVEEAAYVSNFYQDTALVWAYQDNPVAADGGMLTLSNKIAISGSIGEFKDVTSEETKKKDESLNTLKAGLSVVSALMGTPVANKMSQHKNVALETSPKKFGAIVEQGALVTNKLYVDALKNTK